MDREFGDPHTLKLRFNHGGVSVANLERAIDWYRDKLGFEVERLFELPAVPARVAMVRSGDLRFELFEAENSIPLPADRSIPNRDLLTQGNKHVCFEVDDLPAVKRILRDRGVEIALELERGTVFILDDTGNIIEIIEPRAPKLQP
jgi:methylmalonyl-CoA/ethylmalonyl-CoA epimerase